MIYTLAIIFSILFMAFVITLVRNNKLEEKYSILWIIFGIIIIVISFYPSIIDKVSNITGVVYGPSLIFLISFIILIIYIIHLSIVATKQNERIVKAAQEIAILKYELEKMQENYEHALKKKMKCKGKEDII